MNALIAEHIVKIAVGMGIVIGLILFATLLYVSDFVGSSSKHLETGTAVNAVTGEQVPAAKAPSGTMLDQSVQWIFGKPSAPVPPEGAPHD